MNQYRSNSYLSTGPRLVIFLLLVLAIRLQAHGQGIVAPLNQPSPLKTPNTQSVTTGNGIEYHGGPVMSAPHDTYFIWYGNWSGNTATTILPAFVSALNGSAYFNTNMTYGDVNGNVDNIVTTPHQVFDNFSQGQTLSDQSLQSVISAQLQSGALPVDPNGIYFVLTSADVDEKGSAGEFCVQFCAFHTHFAFNAADIKYAFIGNVDRCRTACEAPNLGQGPNGNSGADGMANTIAHEFNETVTDPDLNAWFHNNLSGEVGDLCNFNFGSEFTTSNGAPANVTLGGRNFLIQQNWVNASGGFCGLSFGNPQAQTGFTLVASPATVRVLQLDQGTTTITINAFGGFNGSVSLTALGLPGTVSADFSAVSATSSTLTIFENGGTAPGLYSFTIMGSSGGIVSSIPATLRIVKQCSTC